LSRYIVAENSNKLQKIKIGFGRKKSFEPSMCSHLGADGTGYTSLLTFEACPVGE
jgi:hypothetical protein